MSRTLVNFRALLPSTNTVANKNIAANVVMVFVLGDQH